MFFYYSAYNFYGFHSCRQINNFYNIFFYSLNIIRRFSNNNSTSQAISRYSRGVVDYKRIKIIAGNGGNGIVSYSSHGPFKRIGPGLPNGGSGGRGASIFAKGHTQAKLHKIPATVVGHHGAKGKGSNCSGDDGTDIVLGIPIGTLIYKIVENEDSSERILVGNVEHEALLLCKGGKGGRGNNVSNPHDSEPGEIGETGVFDFELKSISNVGLFGYPNAGKSTLLACISRANPRIASFPYTTTQPCIGTLKFTDGAVITVADLPGAIDGSIATLQHLERTQIIAYVIDKLDDLTRLNQMIEDYNSEMINRPSLIIFTKMDLHSDFDAIDKFIANQNITPNVVLVTNFNIDKRSSKSRDSRSLLLHSDLVHLIRKISHH